MSLTPARLWTALGYPDGPPERAGGEITGSQTRDGATVHDIALPGAVGAMPGLFIVPEGDGPHPAVLYCHAHGNRYAQGARELIHGRPSLQQPYGPALATLGIASLAVDLAPFGARQDEGPESQLAKAALWEGRTMMGDMLADLSVALAWLSQRSEVDAGRLASLGLSMGGTHAYWMAALHPQIRATAHLCVFSDIATLIADGAHDLHGPYMTVPGLIDLGDMAAVAAMVGPRPQLVCLGARDPLSPRLPESPAVERLRAAYRARAHALRIEVDPDTGHMETPAFRAATLAFLQTHLQAARPDGVMPARQQGAERAD